MDILGWTFGGDAPPPAIRIAPAFRDSAAFAATRDAGGRIEPGPLSTAPTENYQGPLEPMPPSTGGDFIATPVGGRAEPPLRSPAMGALGQGGPVIDAAPVMGADGNIVHNPVDSPVAAPASPAGPPVSSPRASVPSATGSLASAPAEPAGASAPGPWGQEAPTATAPAPAAGAEGPWGARPVAAPESPGMLSRLGTGAVSFGLGRLLPVAGQIYSAYKMGQDFDREVEIKDPKTGEWVNRARYLEDRAAQARAAHPPAPPKFEGFDIPYPYKPIAQAVGAVVVVGQAVEHPGQTIGAAGKAVDHAVSKSIEAVGDSMSPLPAVAGAPVVPDPVGDHDIPEPSAAAMAALDAAPPATGAAVGPGHDKPAAAAPAKPAESAVTMPAPIKHDARPAPAGTPPHRADHGDRPAHARKAKTHTRHHAAGLKRTQAAASSGAHAAHVPDTAPHMKPGSVHFASGSASLDDLAKREVAFEAALLKGKGITHVTETGHTDATGSRDQNNELQEARAASVAEELAKSGIIVDRKDGAAAKGGGSNADERRVDITPATAATAKPDVKAPAKRMAAPVTP